MIRGAPAGYGIAAGVLCAGALALFWPGVAHYDTVSQYQQIVIDRYTDWHPPIMARLWSLFHAAGWRGQAPMFVLQIGLYSLGLGLVAVALARGGRGLAAAAVLALGSWPPLLGWQAVVVKDAQMAAALIAATGLVAVRRLAGRPLGAGTTAAVLTLLAYAVFVRANGVFAGAPLAVGLMRPWRWRDWPMRFGLAAAIVLAVLALSPLVNHRVLRAERSGVETVQPLFDIAGIAHRAGPASVPLLSPATWRALEERRCASSILWDIFSIGKRCDFIQRDLAGRPAAAIVTAWTRAIRKHPLAYLSHRAAHWNATMRWLVPWRFPQATPQAASQPNGFGLASPDVRVKRFADLTAPIVSGPLGAPILAFAIALVVLVLSRPDRSPAHALAVPLALSAAAMELSFLVVGIAPDWRYHLWSVAAAGLAGILLLTEPLPRRQALAAAIVLALVLGSSIAARIALPEIGRDYQDLIAPPRWSSCDGVNDRPASHRGAGLSLPACGARPSR